MARREKKPIHKVQMTEGKRNIIHQLLEEYDIQTAEDIQEALKDLLGGTNKEMMEAEMDIKPNKLTVAMEVWIFKFHKIANLLLSHKL